MYVVRTRKRTPRNFSVFFYVTSRHSSNKLAVDKPDRGRRTGGNGAKIWQATRPLGAPFFETLGPFALVRCCNQKTEQKEKLSDTWKNVGSVLRCKCNTKELQGTISGLDVCKTSFGSLRSHFFCRFPPLKDASQIFFVCTGGGWMLVYFYFEDGTI